MADAKISALTSLSTPAEDDELAIVDTSAGSTKRITAGALMSAELTGLTGATAGARFAGATSSGAPASGTFAVGDVVVARDGVLWVCTVAGSPGTWVDASSSGQELSQAQNVTGTVTASGVGITDVPGVAITVPICTRPVVLNWGAEVQSTAGGATGLLLDLYETTSGSTLLSAALGSFTASGQFLSFEKTFRLGTVASSRTFKVSIQGVAASVETLNSTLYPTFLRAYAT